MVLLKRLQRIWCGRFLLRVYVLLLYVQIMLSVQHKMIVEIYLSSLLPCESDTTQRKRSQRLLDSNKLQVRVQETSFCHMKCSVVGITKCICAAFLLTIFSSKNDMNFFFSVPRNDKIKFTCLHDTKSLNNNVYPSLN